MLQTNAVLILYSNNQEPSTPHYICICAVPVCAIWELCSTWKLVVNVSFSVKKKSFAFLLNNILVKYYIYQSETKLSLGPSMEIYWSAFFFWSRNVKMMSNLWLCGLQTHVVCCTTWSSTAERNNSRLKTHQNRINSVCATLTYLNIDRSSVIWLSGYTKALSSWWNLKYILLLVSNQFFWHIIRHSEEGFILNQNDIRWAS